MLKVLTRPFVSIAITACLNGLLWGLLFEHTGFFNAVRVCLAIWAGWLVTKDSKGNKGLWFAAAGGAFVMVVDSLFLSSFSMVGAYFLGNLPFNGRELSMGLLGVVVSLIIFSPVAALLGVSGGLIARRSLRRAV